MKVRQHRIFQTNSRVLFERRKKLASCLFARPLGNGSGRAIISPTKQVFAFQVLQHRNCWVATMLTIKASEKLGREGMVQWNRIFRLFRNIGTSSRGTLKIPKWDTGKCPFYSLFTRNVRNFWSNGKGPVFRSIYTTAMRKCIILTLFDDSNLNAFQTFWLMLHTIHLVDGPWIIHDCNFPSLGAGSFASFSNFSFSY